MTIPDSTYCYIIVRITPLVAYLCKHPGITAHTHEANYGKGSRVLTLEEAQEGVRMLKAAFPSEDYQVLKVMKPAVKSAAKPSAKKVTKKEPKA